MAVGGCSSVVRVLTDQVYIPGFHSRFFSIFNFHPVYVASINIILIGRLSVPQRFLHVEY